MKTWENQIAVSIAIVLVYLLVMGICKLVDADPIVSFLLITLYTICINQCILTDINKKLNKMVDIEKKRDDSK